MTECVDLWLMLVPVTDAESPPETAEIATMRVRTRHWTRLTLPSMDAPMAGDRKVRQRRDVVGAVGQTTSYADPVPGGRDGDGENDEADFIDEQASGRDLSNTDAVKDNRDNRGLRSLLPTFTC